MKKKLLIVCFLFLNITFVLYAEISTAALDEFARAFDLFKKGDFRAAGASFASLYTIRPKDEIAADSCFMAAQAYFNAGDYPTAYRFCEEFIWSYADHVYIPDMEFQRGRILFKMGHFKDASSAFSVFLEKYPHNPLYPSALFWKAESFYQLGDIAQALPLFNEIKENYPDSDKAALVAWRLTVMGLEAREAMYLRLVEFEMGKNNTQEFEKMQREAYLEQRYLRHYYFLKSLRARSDIAEPSVESNNKLDTLLDAKKRALDLLVSLVNAYLEGISP
ncbi:MAG: tetratricopeptide repeat protein [Rectinema sp.]